LKKQQVAPLLKAAYINRSAPEGQRARGNQGDEVVQARRNYARDSACRARSAASFHFTERLSGACPESARQNTKVSGWTENLVGKKEQKR
jgi:hypothetical protein